MNVIAQPLRLSCALIALLLIAGCQTYTVRPAGADMAMFGLQVDPGTRKKQTDYEIADALNKAPLARFPTAIAVVRVQSAAEKSSSHGVSYGRGAYRVLLTPTVERERHLNDIARLPQVSGVVRLNRLVLGKDLRTDKELRVAAARLHADLTLIYTINTQWTKDDDAEPLDVITFGLSGFRNITVTSTATAILVGTHNGYIYATAEVAKDKRYKDNAWRNAKQIEAVQEELEQQAFDGLVDGFIASWPEVVQAYVGSAEARR